jgi:hypothetical protein
MPARGVIFNIQQITSRVALLTVYRVVHNLGVTMDEIDLVNLGCGNLFL